MAANLFYSKGELHDQWKQRNRRYGNINVEHGDKTEQRHRDGNVQSGVVRIIE